MTRAVRQFQLTRDEMSEIAPLDALAPDGGDDVSFFLAACVLPGCEIIPMEVEVDPDAIRYWMERSVAFQARAFGPRMQGRTYPVNGRVPVPARVSALIHLLAWDEQRLDSDPATFATRLARRLSNPALDPIPRLPWQRPARPPAAPEAPAYAGPRPH